MIFLLVLEDGASPNFDAIDPAWTEVLAWGFLRHARWGHDLVFTYGPLGFLVPHAAYLPGTFNAFVAGQIVLAMAFALAIMSMFRHARVFDLVLFTLLFACWCSLIPGDVAWALTFVFATAAAIADDVAPIGRFAFRMTVLALLFAILALIKFSLFPLWILGVAVVVAVTWQRGHKRRALACVAAFPLALLVVWLACAQRAEDLPVFLWRSLEVAAGYRHAMGLPAPLVAECAGVFALIIVSAACVRVGRTVTEGPRWACSILVLAAAALFWLAFFTRGDHWPMYFPALSLLPFALYCGQPDANSSLPRVSAFVVAITGLIAVNAEFGAATTLREFGYLGPRLLRNFRLLAHPSELVRQREAEWSLLAASAELPRTRERVGGDPIDMVGWKQGMIFANQLNYAPRPVFQSYSAYTPALARMNADYFRGPSAPRYVLLHLDAIDQRLPNGEDGLALVALLQTYRPLLTERQFLLLQRDGSGAPALPLPERGAPAHVHVAEEIALPATSGATVAFIDFELSALGKVYTLPFREPPVWVVFSHNRREIARYRLVREAAATGVAIAPLLRSPADWDALYRSQPPSGADSLRIEIGTGWQTLLFSDTLDVSLRTLEILHAQDAP